MLTKTIIRPIIITVALLMIPFIGTQVSSEWQWDLFDFVLIGLVIFICGLTYELIAKKVDGFAYKAGVGLAVLGTFLLVWVNAAVGIIAEDELFNFMYFSVPLVGLIGVFIARFKAKGMSNAAFAMAITQMLVPIVVFCIPSLRGALYETPGIIGVFVLNVIFAMIFVTSGLLLRYAAKKSQN